MKQNYEAETESRSIEDADKVFILNADGKAEEMEVPDDVSDD